MYRWAPAGCSKDLVNFLAFDHLHALGNENLQAGICPFSVVPLSLGLARAYRGSFHNLAHLNAAGRVLVAV